MAGGREDGKEEEGEEAGRGPCAFSGLSRRLYPVPVPRKEPSATLGQAGGPSFGPVRSLGWAAGFPVIFNSLPAPPAPRSLASYSKRQPKTPCPREAVHLDRD